LLFHEIPVDIIIIVIVITASSWHGLLWDLLLLLLGRGLLGLRH
jgi:hypothetical protein